MNAKLSRNGVTTTTLKVTALLLLVLLAKTEGTWAQEVPLPLILNTQGQEMSGEPLRWQNSIWTTQETQSNPS